MQYLLLQHNITKFILFICIVLEQCFESKYEHDKTSKAHNIIFLHDLSIIDNLCLLQEYKWNTIKIRFL